ncbi:MAG: hypothetical protein OEX07_14945, partial [Gammaproteobacteria bacterium]|nr:hypothetical protein [Gammaproteobacteria bacterium]
MKKLTLVNAVGSRCLLLSFAVFISACGQSVDAPDGGESNERSHRTPTNQAPDSIINSPAGNSIS